MNTAMSAATEIKAIKPRKMGFDMSQLKEKYFFRNNPIICTLMYAMSASFPPGDACLARNGRDRT